MGDVKASLPSKSWWSGIIPDFSRKAVYDVAKWICTLLLADWLAPWNLDRTLMARWILAGCVVLWLLREYVLSFRTSDGTKRGSQRERERQAGMFELLAGDAHLIVRELEEIRELYAQEKDHLTAPFRDNALPEPNEQGKWCFKDFQLLEVRSHYRRHLRMLSNVFEREESIAKIKQPDRKVPLPSEFLLSLIPQFPSNESYPTVIRRLTRHEEFLRKMAAENGDGDSSNPISG